MRDSARLIGALRDPVSLSDDEARWEDVICLAREADLLGRLASRVAATTGLQRVPAPPRAHLVAAQVVCKAQEAAVRREVVAICEALCPLDAPVVLLKGAAYLVAGLPPCEGRIFSDIDILVPKHALPAVEGALMLAGYVTTHLHPYDQRYYRRWRHELPPMQHVKRLTTLDVHHNIVAEIGGIRVDAQALLRAARPLDEARPLYVLAPPDMVLHSAVHLFRNEDLTHGLRDLVDIDVLLRHFGAAAAFWPTLIERAEAFDLERPLYYALRWTSRLLATPVPAEVQESVARHAPAGPARLLMDALLARALAPTPAAASTRWARRAMYVRGHWLRLPLPLLALHLTVKAFRREEQPA